MNGEMTKKTIYEVCCQVDDEIESDLAGGCPIAKSFLMAYLVKNQKLKNYAEIGVYKGKSFFPVAYSINLNGGKSYGIDPYNYNDALESDAPNNVKNDIDKFFKKANFDDLYQNVNKYLKNCGYGESSKIIRKTSQDAFIYFKENNIKIDFLHIDGNHDTKHVRQDFELYNGILEEGGFVVFDDIDWKSVNSVYKEAKKTLTTVFECKYFGILYKEKDGYKDFVKIEKLNKRLTAIYEKFDKKKVRQSNKLPEVTVGVLTYNHENYIGKCLQSIVDQSGNFKCNIIVINDNSTDGTDKVIKEFIKKNKQTSSLKIKYVKNNKNFGIAENYCKLINLIKHSKCDYFTFCEGDDYYLSSERIVSHLALHSRNPEMAVSFNKLLLYYQENNEFELFEPDFNTPRISTEELVIDNKPGTFSGSFYDSNVLNYIKDDLFKNKFTVDWFFNIYCSQFGDIGHINVPMTCYRKHSNGFWSGNKAVQNNKTLVSNILEYNKYLNFLYDKEFQIIRNDHVRYLLTKNAATCHKLVVIDNIFPNPLSGFSYYEFTNILSAYKDSVIYTAGGFSQCLSSEPIDNMIVSYKRSHPEFGDRVFKLDHESSFDAELLYGIFLNTAYYDLLPLADNLKTPFVFTLYPGGGFLMNDKKSDKMLKKVFASPWFKKVIVTQQATYNYLVKKRFCKKEDIEFIFGVVTDPNKIGKNISNKKHFGIDKDTLDICFVAHKYSENGHDKGYDIFIDSAKKLSEKYDNIAFHVVGPWDEKVVDVSGIKNITFYGSKSASWFEGFYKDKDIIISPNKNGVLAKGAFDGFPTTSVTDASLCGVAMFVTDPLKMNGGRFKDGEEIVILKHSTDDIVEKIEYYLNNPKKLKSIGEKGKIKSEKIYSYESQMAPRLELLQKIRLDSIRNRNNKKKYDKQKYVDYGRVILSEITPNIAKRAYRKAKRVIKK